jgi:hypothetical protein
MSVCPSCDQPTSAPEAPFCAWCGFALPVAANADAYTESDSVAEPCGAAENHPVFGADAGRLTSAPEPTVRRAHRQEGARAVPVALAALTGAVVLAIALSHGSSSGPSRGARSARRHIAAAAAIDAGAVRAARQRAVATGSAPLPGGSSRAAGATARYRAGPYSFAYPASWTVSKDNQPAGSFRETVLESADRAAKVAVDYSAGETTDPAAKAAQVESATSLTPGYQRMAFRATTIGSRPAFEWIFKVAAPHPRRADLFVSSGGSGFALLAYGSDFARARSAGRAIAESLTAPR